VFEEVSAIITERLMAEFGLPIVTHKVMMEEASTSEILVNFYQTACHNPEDSHLQDNVT
jgi:hypothetical protein